MLIGQSNTGRGRQGRREGKRERTGRRKGRRNGRRNAYNSFCLSVNQTQIALRETNYMNGSISLAFVSPSSNINNDGNVKLFSGMRSSPTFGADSPIA